MNWRLFTLRLTIFASALFALGGLASAQNTNDINTHYIDAELRPDAAIRAAVINGTFDASFIKPQPNFIAKRYQAAVQQYAQSWGSLPQIQISTGGVLHQGAKGHRVAKLRSRLGLQPGTYFDNALAQKISDYRRAHGIARGRHVDTALIRSLNLGFNHHHRLIRVNAQRAAQLPPDLGPRFVLVDAGNQMLYMYEGQRVIGSMRVIVGKAKDPTPMLAGYIRHTIVNPYWNIPPDLVSDRFAPRVLQQGESYLTSRRFEALSGWEEDAQVLSYKDVNWNAVASGAQILRLRQRPGPGNGMGDIKFMFPNRFGVYLHDTPSKALFKKSRRTLSAGCVRIEKPWQLAQWLYGEHPKAVGSAPEQKIPLSNITPVYISYFTAVPTAKGFEFRHDVYDRDKRAQNAFGI